MKKVWIVLLFLVAAGAAILWFLSGGDSEQAAGEPIEPSAGTKTIAAVQARPAKIASEDKKTTGKGVVSETDEDDQEESVAKTEEEIKAEQQEALVEAFDAMTDKWMEPNAKGVSMDEVNAFSSAFKRVPKDRQEECIQRALNLIPDENVMLLVGVLMDKSMDREIVETVFNDILNRDEDVKKPVLKKIFEDKSHPCYADAAWILDVTGEK